MSLDTTFENLWKQHYGQYVEHFEEGRKKARSNQAFIDHFEGQIRLDFPKSGFVNYYIKDVVYYFYHLYNLGSSISEILLKILEIRKEHMAKSSEKPDQYERSSDGFNLETKDQSLILNFIAHHYAKKQFLEFLDRERIKESGDPIEKINQDKEMPTLEDITDGKKQKPTNAQKLLAVHYLQKVNLFPSTFDILPLSEFITFLTGQNQKNTYDQLREIDDYKKTKKNLMVVRKQFERLGMDDVLKLIDNDLKNCWK